MERGVSTEEVINVEYVEKYPPPEPQDCLIHDDWVSAVAVCEKWFYFMSFVKSVQGSERQLLYTK